MMMLKMFMPVCIISFLTEGVTNTIFILVNAKNAGVGEEGGRVGRK